MPGERTPDVASAPSLDAKTALVIVDVQNDFASVSGNLYVAGGEQILSLVNDLIRQAKRGGACVVYTQDWHPESTPHFQKDGGIWPVHCVRDTWGADFHDELLVEGPVVRKGTGGEDGYSGFSVRDPQTGQQAPTELERILRERGTERVVVVGLARDVCVKETALDARRLGFETSMVADATRSVNLRPGDGARAVAQMVQAGVTIV